MRTIKTWLATIAVLLCSISVSATNYSDWTSDNKGQDNSTSSYTYTINANAGDVLTFDWSVSSESNYDWLIATLNGSEILKKSGVDSGSYTYTFNSSGVNTLIVKYTKDNSQHSNNDQVKIYNIKLTSSNSNLIDSGTCGDNLTWELSKDGELIISGTGAMWNNDYNGSPWYAHRGLVKSIVIENGVTSIGDNAFCGCYRFTSVIIPNSVSSIGNYAFSDCSGLTSVTIPNSVTSLGDFAFAGCSGLTSVIIPNSVTSIGNKVFYGCSALTSVTIPNSVTSIGNSAFYGCSGLTSVTIPNSVSSIGNYAFSDCSGLTSVTIPNSVTSIADYAFYRCSGLTSVIIPNSVTSIGNYAFFSCSALTSVTIPNSVTSIADYAFAGCSGLTSVTIPNSVTSIGFNAFCVCEALVDIYCYAKDVPSTNTYAFQGTNSENITLHVPKESIVNYKSTAPWSKFANIVVLPGEDVIIVDGEDYNNRPTTDVATITYTRTLSKTNTWNALYVPFEIPMTAEFCKNYDVAYFNDVHCYDNYIGEKEDGVLGQDGVIDGMDMEVLQAQEGSVLNANYPYLIRAKNASALNMNIKVEDATLYKAKETTVSCSSVFMKFDVTGIYTTKTAGELKGEFDVYAISGGGWKQALNANQKLNPFRLYLKLTSIDGSPVKATEGAMSRINIRLQGEDSETGILEMESEDENKTETFDLSGRRVQKAQKGLYIVNGKKVIK